MHGKEWTIKKQRTEEKGNEGWLEIMGIRRKQEALPDSKCFQLLLPKGVAASGAEARSCFSICFLDLCEDSVMWVGALKFSEIASGQCGAERGGKRIG